ncbi:MAG: FAD-dependent oxidoreductase [Acidobacteriota bacterium]
MGHPETASLRRGVDHAPVVILGAGPAGIAAAVALGPAAILLDAREDVGGLSGTFERSGATFDVGGHSFHTPHPAVRDLVFGSLDMFEQRREARCLVGDALIRYPFQKHFRELGNAGLTAECERGLREADGGEGARDYESYLVRRFGMGIARHFLLPYNRKLWRGDLSRLSTEWTRERIAAPDGVLERFQDRGGRRAPLQDDTRVAYPARGGFGEITKALAREVHDLRLGARVALVDIRAKEVVTEEGRRIGWDRLVSTLPLPDLLRFIPDTPANLRRDGASLERLPLRLFLVVIGRPVDTEVQRIYVADPDSPAHKIVVNHNSSDFLRSRRHHGISGEMALPLASGVSRAALEARFLASLRRTGLVRSNDPLLDVASIDVPWGYPVPTRGRDAAVSRIRGWLESAQITIAGRFAEWAYINADEAMHRGWVVGTALRDAVA